MKILIVEDDNISRLILLTKLKKLGHEVIETKDGEEGWLAFVKEQPRLVITDWMMPKISGIQLCEMIRARNWDKYTGIIMLTALTGKKNYHVGMDAGADDFINKPVDMEELTARLRVAERMLGLQTEVKQLEGLLTMCSYCKNIRDENEVWQPIEGYIAKRSEATFSHGFCPSCYEKHWVPQLQQSEIDSISRLNKLKLIGEEAP